MIRAVLRNCQSNATSCVKLKIITSRKHLLDNTTILIWSYWVVDVIVIFMITLYVRPVLDLCATLDIVMSWFNFGLVDSFIFFLIILILCSFSIH